MIEFTVHGIPKAQPRVKAFARGKHAGVYTPPVADDWKTLVALECSRRRPTTPATGEVFVDLIFLLPPPAKPKTSRPINKPDADNLAKAVLDVMTACCWWHDDSQIVALNVEKAYSDGATGPGVVIRALLKDGPKKPARKTTREVR